MGVRNWMQRHKFAEPVPGTLELKTCAHGRLAGAHVDVDATGIISAPGINPVTVQFQGKAPHNKRPRTGYILPVVVDRADPQQFQIEWDQVPTESELIEQDLENYREQASTTPLNRGFPGVFGQGGGTNITVTGGLSSLPPQAQARIQQMLGNLGQAFEQSAGSGNVVFEQPTVTINGQQVSGGAMPGGVGAMFEQFQQMAAGMAGHPPANLQSATAVVLAAHDAPVPQLAANQAPGGVVDITLDVRGPDGSAYSTTTRIAFSTHERRAKITGPGTELPVLVDPADHSHLTIDTSKIPGW